MKYQIAYFDPASEAWYFYRRFTMIVEFDSFEDAEREAIRLSDRDFQRQSVLVLTLHACLRTDCEMPKVEPVKTLQRIEIPTVTFDRV